MTYFVSVGTILTQSIKIIGTFTLRQSITRVMQNLKHW